MLFTARLVSSARAAYPGQWDDFRAFSGIKYRLCNASRIRGKDISSALDVHDTHSESPWDHTVSQGSKCLIVPAISEFHRNLIWVKFCILLGLKVKEQISGG